MIIFSVAGLLARAICANGVSLESSLNGGRGSVKPRPHQQHVEATGNLWHSTFDMSKEIEHVQFVSTCRKDEKIVRHVAKNGNMPNGNIRHVEATFDMLLRHVAGVDGA